MYGVDCTHVRSSDFFSVREGDQSLNTKDSRAAPLARS